ncbi:hypothetical protein O3M35_000931 [Rhynocoris fuscipes]|uniref:Gustatory receptor n=1 Tax=Rhynocoris fuscipes TaxID=488301 RepID=A0AAW1DQK7_9HEMI
MFPEFNYHFIKIYDPIFVSVSSIIWAIYEATVSTSGALFIISYSYILILSTLFTCTVTSIKLSFIYLKNCINEYGVSNRLPIILNAHYLMIDCCKYVNSLYGPLLLGLSAFMFILSTTGSYLLIQTEIELSEEITIIFFILASSYQLFKITELCTSTCEHSLKINDKLSKLIHTDYKGKHCDYKYITLVHVAFNRKPVFTAHNFFNINRNMIASMLAFTCTYIIVLIQFDLTFNNKDDDHQQNIVNSEMSEDVDIEHLDHDRGFDKMKITAFSVCNWDFKGV